jgi:hypothetical protein
MAPKFLEISAVISDEPSSQTMIELVIFFNFIMILAILFSSLYAGIPIVIFNSNTGCLLGF